MNTLPVTPVSVHLKPDLRAKLVFLAEASQQTKSDVLRNLLQKATLDHVQVSRIEAEVGLPHENTDAHPLARVGAAVRE